MTKTSSKLTLSVSGLVNDFLNQIPNGEKAAIINQILLDSIKNGTIYNAIFINLGVSDGMRVKKKVEKLLNGIILTSDLIPISGQINSNQTAGIDNENNQNSDIIDHQETSLDVQQTFFSNTKEDEKIVEKGSENEFGFFQK